MSNQDEKIILNNYIETLIRSKMLRVHRSNLSYFDASSLVNFKAFLADCEQYVIEVEPYQNDMIAYAKTEKGKAFYELIQQIDVSTLQTVWEQTEGTTQLADVLVSTVAKHEEAPAEIKNLTKRRSVVKFCKDHLQNNVVTRKWQDHREKRIASGKPSFVKRVVKFGAKPFRGIKDVLDYVPEPGVSLVKRG